MTTKPDMLLWLSDARGQYIPRDFAQSFKDRDKNVSGVSAEEWAILDAGPDHEWYWETWDDVCNNASVTDDAGVKFTLHQDGDLWLVPDGMEWSDKEQWYVWPEEEGEGEDQDPAWNMDDPGDEATGGIKADEDKK